MRAPKNSFGLLTILMVVWIVAEYFVFHYLYAPQLLLRQVIRQPDKMTPKQFEELRLAALNNRFDEQDSFTLIDVMESNNMDRVVLEIFANLKNRDIVDDRILLWYADRLRKYGRHLEAEDNYLHLLDNLRNKKTQP